MSWLASEVCRFLRRTPSFPRTPGESRRVGVSGAGLEVLAGRGGGATRRGRGLSSHVYGPDLVSHLGGEGVADQAAVVREHGRRLVLGLTRGVAAEDRRADGKPI